MCNGATKPRDAHTMAMSLQDAGLDKEKGTTPVLDLFCVSKKWVEKGRDGYTCASVFLRVLMGGFRFF
jgi:hypothetical protein